MQGLDEQKARRLGRAVGWVAILAICFWFYQRLARVEGLIDMVYDSSTCGQPGNSDSRADACFRSLGYTVRPLGPQGEVVQRPEWLQLYGRVFVIVVDFDGRRRVARCHVESWVKPL